MAFDLAKLKGDGKQWDELSSEERERFVQELRQVMDKPEIKEFGRLIQAVPKLWEVLRSFGRLIQPALDPPIWDAVRQQLEQGAEWLRSYPDGRIP